MDDNVLELYNEGKLIIRAVDLPNLHKSDGITKYDCSIWANEFAMMMNNEFDSVSSTLLIPNVGVRTYKNVGFLVDSDLAQIQHIASADSGSRGSYANGDFSANKSDFNSVQELATYIAENNRTVMNEINMNIPLNSVVGLVQVKCDNNNLNHLKRLLIVQECLYQLTGIRFEIYEYDKDLGKIEKVILTEEMLDTMCKSPDAVNEFDYWTNYSDEFYEGSISIEKGYSI